jgi:hypothetical protein
VSIGNNTEYDESELMSGMKQLFDETDYAAEEDLAKLDYRMS